MPTPEKAQNARQVTALSLAIAAELRAQSARRRISAAELQRRTKIAKNTLGALLNGTKVPDVSQLSKICGVLDLSMVELFSAAEEAVRREATDPGQQAAGH